MPQIPLKYALAHLLLTCLSILLVSFVSTTAVGQSSTTGHSLLASGKWIKIAVNQSGFYTLSYEKLRELGFENPEKVGVYGRGGRLLSESLDVHQGSTLPQVPLLRHNRAIYFYGEGTTHWYFDRKHKNYQHVTNHYTTQGYYLLSDVATPGPLVMQSISPIQAAGAPQLEEGYDALYLHEKDRLSLKQSGRLLVGEAITNNRPTPITLSLGKGSSLTSNITLNFAYTALPEKEGILSLSINDKIVGKDTIRSTEDRSDRTYQAGIYHRRYGILASYNGNEIPLKLQYNNPLEHVYLDYISCVANRKLQYESGEQLLFRRTTAQNKVALFSLEGFPQETVIIATESDQPTPYSIPYNHGGNRLTFSSNTLIAENEQPIQFLATTWQDAYTPQIIGEIANCDLLSEPTPDLIIVTPQLFFDEAQRLADYHRKADNLTVLVMTQDQLLNEFNGGTPDATAYRLMCRYYHKKRTLHKDPLQLLLFGDGASDNRRISETWKQEGLKAIPFLLTYQGVNSLNVYSYTTDDYFGFLEKGQDALNNGQKTLSIAIGRLPLRTLEDAHAVVDKIIRYAQNEDLGTWKTNTLFVADNKDYYIHQAQADRQAKILDSIQPELFCKKVYLDAFPRKNVAGLTTIPNAKKKLFDAINKGVLLINYVGHGSPSSWTDEQIMTQSDITRLSNKRLPIWITATCDFTNFDNSLTSGGEHSLLNPHGGSIALITTSRIVYDSYNEALNKLILRYLFSTNDRGELRPLSEALRMGKNNTYSSDTINKLNFLYLGDPALRLKMPTHKVTLQKINGITLQEADTIALHALESVTLEGAIHNVAGTIDGNFEGEIFITIFDAQHLRETLPENIPNGLNSTFKYQEYSSIIYAGTAKVKQGLFSTQFVVPKDVAYAQQPGRINFYAYAPQQKIEAMGVDKRIQIEMGSAQERKDTTPPQILQCYLNTPSPEKVTTVGSTPLFVAEVFDENGINLSEGGVGHNVTLSIDNNPSLTFVLNEYYTANPLETGKGSIIMQLPPLSVGNHTAVFKVWDVFNNVSEKSLSFRVDPDLSTTVYTATVYPNPVTTEGIVSFKLHTNIPGEASDLTIELYDYRGQCMAQSPNFSLTSNAQGILEASWNIHTTTSTALTPGLYLYRCIIKNSNGKTSYASGKLLLATPVTE